MGAKYSDCYYYRNYSNFALGCVVNVEIFDC